MKEFRVTLLDQEHADLTRIKNQSHCKNWHDFLITAAKSLDNKTLTEEKKK